jgi:hypothetical protein
MVDTQVVAARTWPGGPLRQMSASKVGSTFIPFKTIGNGTFAGRYVCDGCREPSKGVYRQNEGKTSGNGEIEWLCDSCLAGKPRIIRTPEEKAVQKAAMSARFALARQARQTAAHPVQKESAASKYVRC